MSKPIALGYSRVSTKEQVDRGSSIPFQQEKIREKAKELGYELKHQYSDDGVSGGSTNRKEFSELLAEINRTKADAIVFYELSRTTRDLKDLLYLQDMLDEKGIRLVSVAENLNLDTDEGDFMFKMRGLVNERYRKDLIKRVRAKMFDKHQKGTYCGGVVPYGYSQDGLKEKARLVINETEAEIVRQMFSRFEEIPSFRSVVRWLNANGIKTRPWIDKKKKQHGGTTFAQSSIKRILTNPIYKGYQTYGKRPEAKKFAPKDKWVIAKANVEPIISEEQFDRAQKIIANRPLTKKKRKYNVVYILDGGIMRCECGATFNGYTQRKDNGKLYFYYKCHNYMSKGLSVCPRKALIKSEIEEKIVKEISNRIKLHFEESEAKAIKEDAPDEELKRIERQIQGLQGKRSKLLVLYEEDTIKFKDELIKRMDEIALELEQAEDNKRQLEEEIDPKNKATRKSLMERVNAGLDAMTEAERKRVLKQLVKSLVVYYDGKVDLELYEIE